MHIAIGGHNSGRLAYGALAYSGAYGVAYYATQRSQAGAVSTPRTSASMKTLHWSVLFRIALAKLQFA